MNTPSEQKITVCPACDLVLAEVEQAEHTALLCPRCGQILHRTKQNSIVKTCALSLTGLLLFIPAMFTPLLTMGILGDTSNVSLASSIYTLFSEQHLVVGTLVLATAIALPLFTLASLFLVSASLLINKPHPVLARLLRYFIHLKEWAMTDVYLIGIFVSIIKLMHTGTIIFNIGFFCFIGMVIVTLAAESAVDKKLFWTELEKADDTQWTPATISDAQRLIENKNYQVCHTCHKIFWQNEASQQEIDHCSRCGESLHKRKKDSLQRTWALVCTAIIFTLPANVLPIMEVRYIGVPERSTILDGIIYFFQEGSYGIGFIIFFASILVPLFKIVGLLIILLSVHFRWQRGKRHKTIMFRFIGFIGRWSMLDVFVITLLCTLVQFGILSTIELAPAAIFFAGVVVSTMTAAITFDPRLIWDENIT